MVSMLCSCTASARPAAWIPSGLRASAFLNPGRRRACRRRSLRPGSAPVPRAAGYRTVRADVCFPVRAV